MNFDDTLIYNPKILKIFLDDYAKETKKLVIIDSETNDKYEIINLFANQFNETMYVEIKKLKENL